MRVGATHRGRLLAERMCAVCIGKVPNHHVHYNKPIYSIAYRHGALPFQESAMWCNPKKTMSCWYLEQYLYIVHISNAPLGSIIVWLLVILLHICARRSLFINCHNEAPHAITISDLQNNQSGGHCVSKNELSFNKAWICLKCGYIFTCRISICIL